jgi:hypothetical protein
VLNKRAALISPSFTGLRVMHTFPDIIQLMLYCARSGGYLVLHQSRGVVDRPWLASTRTARICNCLPAVMAQQDQQLAQIRPKSGALQKETTLGGFCGPRLAGHAFQ